MPDYTQNPDLFAFDRNEKRKNAVRIFIKARQYDRALSMRILRSTDDALMTWVPLDDPTLPEGNIASTGGGIRDACVFFDDEVGKYLMYYADLGIMLRTSDDLIHWSDGVTDMCFYVYPHH